LEKGVTHTKRRLHKVGYFAELMAGSEEIDASIRPLLKPPAAKRRWTD
jgi:hypothetical protein